MFIHRSFIRFSQNIKPIDIEIDIKKNNKYAQNTCIDRKLYI